jgi:hypothetical protein
MKGESTMKSKELKKQEAIERQMEYDSPHNPTEDSKA